MAEEVRKMAENYKTIPNLYDALLTIANYIDNIEEINRNLEKMVSIKDEIIALSDKEINALVETILGKEKKGA